VKQKLGCSANAFSRRQVHQKFEGCGIGDGLESARKAMPDQVHIKKGTPLYACPKVGRNWLRD
jgi:hypothetical protein